MSAIVWAAIAWACGFLAFGLFVVALCKAASRELPPVKRGEHRPHGGRWS